MKDIEIKLSGIQNPGEIIIKIDDQPACVKKNEFGSLICKYQTHNEKVNIKVYRLLDVGGLAWFITQLFFFIISIFGLLDIHRKEKCFVIDVEVNVDLKDENIITLQFNTSQENSQAAHIQTGLTIQEISNKYSIDVQAKRILKCLTITKIILALSIMIITILVLFNKL